MEYIVLKENEEISEGIKSRTQLATEDIGCFKVIEERLSPSGRIEYWTFPLYTELSEDVVSGKSLHYPKEKPSIKRLENGKVKIEKGFVHAFAHKEDAIQYMESISNGYPETRPTIYRCVVPNGADYIETLRETCDGNVIKCYATFHLRFCEPLLERVYGMTREYRRMDRVEKTKKKFGIIYDENQINGDVDNY